jgi:hypothetical protein
MLKLGLLSSSLLIPNQESNSNILRYFLHMVDSDLVPVAIHYVAFYFLGEHVDVSRSELSSADSSFEEQVQFGKSTSSWFRNSEVGVDQAEEARSSLETVEKGVMS